MNASINVACRSTTDYLGLSQEKNLFHLSETYICRQISQKKKQKSNDQIVKASTQLFPSKNVMNHKSTGFLVLDLKVNYCYRTRPILEITF